MAALDFDVLMIPLSILFSGLNCGCFTFGLKTPSRDAQDETNFKLASMSLHSYQLSLDPLQEKDEVECLHREKHKAECLHHRLSTATCFRPLSGASIASNRALFPACITG